ncbi:phage tail tube protein [Mesomycoplasma molare]|uniref:Uncharacterized protein n=1 Tax=Mesomycoplasma molare TaxID=171288 RepID=A0ABY5TTR5_9BACT|nr:hypothetical protein [Mesomycoplasma molare]UWD34055.1 hypothetical protein NX772_03035 [Mesomycoplasma molare]
MLKTNAGNKLFIAIDPWNVSTQLTYEELKFISELKYNYSNNKEDRNYFHNKGNTTSITTGATHSLSITIDFDDKNTLHKYLLKLLLGDAQNLNGQYIRLELLSLPGETENKKIVISGKCTINFKNHFPSGNPNEIQKLQLDLMPQDDNWTTAEENR